MSASRLIAIGASAGGVEALSVLLSGLKADFRIPIAVVQHLPASSSADVRMIFGRHCRNRIAEIEDKMPVEPGHVYFAPPAYHVLVECSRSFALSQDEPVNFSRPSIDVFFDSASRAYGAGLVGVILTGANEDGARGMQAIQECGGLTLVQDPATAEISTMPSETLRRIRPDRVLPLSGISSFLNDLQENRFHG